MANLGEASDALDRVKELLRSAIDAEHHIANRINNLADKLLGSAPTPSSAGKSSVNSIDESIANLLGNLERAQSDTNIVINRFQDTKI
jgi:hypothetical protein